MSALSAKTHWIALRVCAVAVVPLIVWLVYSIVSLAGADYEIVLAWLSHPLNAVLLILFILAAFTHGALGTQEIIEDYVHAKGLKCASMIACNLFFLAVGAACIVSIVKIAFIGGV